MRTIEYIINLFIDILFNVCPCMNFMRMRKEKYILVWSHESFYLSIHFWVFYWIKQKKWDDHKSKNRIKIAPKMCFRHEDLIRILKGILLNSIVVRKLETSSWVSRKMGRLPTHFQKVSSSIKKKRLREEPDHCICS